MSKEQRLEAAKKCDAIAARARDEGLRRIWEERALEHRTAAAYGE